MREKFDQLKINNSMEIDDEYTDLISFKTIQEMDDPVLSPHTGHIYDRMDIVKWIELRGTDPVDRDRRLTNEMLISGRFVKQISEETARKSAKDNAEVSQKLQSMETRHNQDINEMRSMMQAIIEQNKGLQSENKKLTQENSELRKENELLKKHFVNPVWSQFGSDIDSKLKKGSAPERTAALRMYASKVKTAVNDDKLQAAVNDTQSLKDAKISTPRFFSWLVGTSETTRVTSEFQDKVNEYKGWELTQ